MPIPEPTTAPYYRYALHVEIPATDVGVVIDAIEGEPFGLKDRFGEREINRQIREQEISIQANSPVRWDDFESDLNVLSVYLSQYITGREIFVEPTGGAPRLEGWKIVGRRGETIRLKLDLMWEASSSSIIDGDEDVEDAARRWSELPEWARTALRVKHPKLRAL